MSTPALYKGVVYEAGTDGELLAVDQQTGRVYWRISQHSQTWGSPVTIDDQMVIGDCNGGLHDYDISNPRVHQKSSGPFTSMAASSQPPRYGTGCCGSAHAEGSSTVSAIRLATRSSSESL